jgi:hypothetical protein
VIVVIGTEAKVNVVLFSVHGFVYKVNLERKNLQFC